MFEFKVSKEKCFKFKCFFDSILAVCSVLAIGISIFTFYNTYNFEKRKTVIDLSPKFQVNLEKFNKNMLYSLIEAKGKKRKNKMITTNEYDNVLEYKASLWAYIEALKVFLNNKDSYESCICAYNESWKYFNYYYSKSITIFSINCQYRLEFFKNSSPVISSFFDRSMLSKWFRKLAFFNSFSFFHGFHLFFQSTTFHHFLSAQ